MIIGQTPHSLEHTQLLKTGGVWHYTCNPPSKDIIKRYKIKALGDTYGCGNPREVLLIPGAVFQKKGLVKKVEDLMSVDNQVLKIMSENLLKTLK